MPSDGLYIQDREAVTGERREDMRRTDRLCFSVAIAVTLMLLGGGNAVAQAPQGGGMQELLDRLDALETDLATTNAALLAAEARIAVLESAPLDDFVSVDFGSINGLAGPHIIFHDANVHVRSGSGSTDNGGGAPNGRGNLIVGYNGVLGGETRTGSHNLIVGDDHSYTSYGGFVAGVENNILAPHASVSGGNDNTASGDFSSVSGGTLNTASGIRSSVSGGQRNEASGDSSSVSGGNNRSALGLHDWVAGGLFQDN